MKNDERVNADVKIAKSIGYTIFWFGIFAVILYRWFILNQTLMDTLDFFLVWFIASLAQFFALAIKGIPITYPVTMNKKEQLYFVFLVPLSTGILSALIVFFKIGSDIRRLLCGFTVSFFGTLFLFFLYRIILHMWEKRNT
ncbi:hypothetical protein [Serpentinicella alkaliphila]|uniref:Uncharacterized protein n=1 Tax=Serpentinicella alkaliphila TaxID=1734049 RepID=A0A4R2TNB1_9FIRM|nr:hypothetical protein [Serpentinicella alkaliphila]QUH24477.1 hypothetical protein HZR23_00795 [Serpentinicella alkaliphila]TCQ04127.1 hypothetical protein EDD79_10075 [Serpentinicella alkaliphila]